MKVVQTWLRNGTLTALSSLTFFAIAQTSSTPKTQAPIQPVNVVQKGDVSLPLVSVGKDVGWKIGAEDYRINAPAAASGRITSLEVFSPDINRNDYANQRDRKSYYGDELYGKKADLKTVFTLSGKQAQLFKQSFGTSSKHAYAQLYQGGLEPGFYPLSISSFGNGKNSFQIRASQGVRVEASQFTVNARGQYNQDQLVAFVDVNPSAIGKTVRLENYDADGLQEMQLTLVLPNGLRRTMNVSEDTKWAGNNIAVSKKMIGTWKILARLLPSTKQFSNSVAFRFRLNGKPLFARLPGFTAPAGQPLPPQPTPKGKLNVVSSAGFCGQETQFSAGFKLNGTQYTTSVNLELAAGTYTLEPDQLEGASVEQLTVTVEANRTSNVTIKYRVQPEIKLEPDQTRFVLGETRTITMTVSSKFAIRIPVGVEIDLPEGIVSSESEIDPQADFAKESVSIQSTVSKSEPLVFKLPVRALSKPPVFKLPIRATKTLENATILASLEPNCGATASSSITVVSPAQLVLEKTVNRDLIKTGETAEFTVIARNIGGYVAQGVHLTDVIPVGLEGANLDERFDLQVGEAKMFKLSTKAVQLEAGTITNTAKLEWNNTNLTASASVRLVVDSKLEPEPQPKPKPAPAKLELAKSVNRDLVKAGEKVSYTITVRNVGGSIAQGIKIYDPLVDGLEGTILEQTFDLEAGASKSFTVAATVGPYFTDELENTVSLNWNDTQLEASAKIRVEPPPPAKLELLKTVDRSEVRPGEHVNFSITVINSGSSIARDVNVSDMLPQGLRGNVLTEKFDLEPGGKREFLLPAIVEAKGGVVENTAQLSWNGQNLQASASVEVLPIQPGTITVTSAALWCGDEVALEGVKFSLQGRTYLTPATIKLEPGTYTLEPETLDGANALQPVTVKLEEDQAIPMMFEYAPETELLIQSDSSLELGEYGMVTAFASSAFPFKLPLMLDLELPNSLSSDDELSIAGDVGAGESLELNVEVRALELGKQEVTASIGSCGDTTSTSLDVIAKPLPPESRASEILVLAKLGVKVDSGYVVVSDRLPANSTYIPGSSEQLRRASFPVNAQPSTTAWTRNPNEPGVTIPDPWISGDRLFWVLPADSLNGDVVGVAYRVAHTESIVIPRDPAVIWVEPDARRVPNSPNPNASNVVFDPGSPAGKLVGIGEVRLLEGKPEVLEAFSKARAFGTEMSIPTPISNGGPATRLQVSFERAVNDPAERPIVVVRAFDENNLPANDKFATLELKVERAGSSANLDPVTPDAAPEIPGLQVKLENGVGRVLLDNFGNEEGAVSSAPVILIEARITDANGVTISSAGKFRADELSLGAANPLASAGTPVSSTARPFVAVGLGTAQLNWSTDTGFSVGGALRAFARGTVFNDWLLTVAVNQLAMYDGSGLAFTGDLLPPTNPFERFPLLGDSSSTGSDARSSDGFYVRLERGPSYVMYGQISPNFRGLLTAYGPNFNGFQGLAVFDGASINSFAAFIPNANQSFKARGDGTSLYRLPFAPLEPGSERISVVVYDKNNPSVKLEAKSLRRLADYALNETSGTIQLSRPLNSGDANGNPQFLEVEYASVLEAAPRDWRYGVQATLGSDDGFSVTATALRFRPADNAYQFGLGAAYKIQGFQLGLEAAFGGPLGAGGGLGLGGQLNYSNSSFQLQARYQELWKDYVDPNATSSSTPGRSISGGLGWKLNDAFSIAGSITHNQEFTTGIANTNAGLEGRANFGILKALLGIFGRLGNGNLTPGQPWNAGGFIAGGLELDLNPIKFTGLQRIPFTPETFGETDLGIEWLIAPSFSIRLTDTLVYEPSGVRQTLSLGARGGVTNNELIRLVTGQSSSEPFGNTNLSASYDLVSTSGTAGRARVGLDTSIPLGSNWSTQLGGELALDAPNPLTASGFLGLAYSSDSIKASTRAQFSLQPTGIKQVYTAGAVIQLDPTFAISPSIEYAALPDLETRADGVRVRDGGRFSIAAAWRADDLSMLTNHSGRFGIYAPNGDEVQGEIQFGYVANEQLFARAGAAYKFAGTFTGQVGAGLTYFITDQFGLGTNAAYQFQPSTGTGKFSFGLEASLRVFNGVILSAGTNFIGFDGLSGWSTAPGFFVRLEFLFNDQFFAPKK
jgi:uncharacterized repeat protein (TIGR01451 family)